MRSTIVLFIPAFAVFGLLLGYAEVYSNGQESQSENSTMQGNTTASNSTQSAPANNSTESGQ